MKIRVMIARFIRITKVIRVISNNELDILGLLRL